MAALLALSGALLWGAGDFLGGLASRRLAVLTVLAVSQAIGLAGVILWVALAGDPFPGATELLPAAAAGVAGLIGLGALYRGLAVGAMGIVRRSRPRDRSSRWPLTSRKASFRMRSSGSASRS